ncbi:MAG: SWIM zinc finger family protein [Deltaproteobacteria bacterium]
MWNDWRPYVPVASRRRIAEREMRKRQKKGQPVSPVVIDGRAIAKTFWGRAWCDNLERYSDYSNRLPRGRTYVRNGSVIDLQIGSGAVTAVVSGSELYDVAVKVAAVPSARFGAIRKDCAGAIDSLVELLQGRLSKGVMERLCREKDGLFPAPAEITLKCSCPDWAEMCKHVAAVLYGVGARLDERPELLFRLRQVDEQELIASAGGLVPSKPGPRSKRVLAADDLSALFGLELDPGAPPAPKPKAKRPPAKAASRAASRSPAPRPKSPARPALPPPRRPRAR